MMIVPRSPSVYHALLLRVVLMLLTVSNCKLCHEYPLPTSNEGIALQRQINIYISFHKGVHAFDLRVQYCGPFFVDGGKCPYGPSCPMSHHKYTTANDLHDFTRQMNKYIESL